MFVDFQEKECECNPGYRPYSAASDCNCGSYGFDGEESKEAEVIKEDLKAEAEKVKKDTKLMKYGIAGLALVGGFMLCKHFKVFK